MRTHFKGCLSEEVKTGCTLALRKQLLCTVRSVSPTRLSHVLPFKPTFLFQKEILYSFPWLEEWVRLCFVCLFSLAQSPLHQLSLSLSLILALFREKDHFCSNSVSALRPIFWARLPGQAGWGRSLAWPAPSPGHSQAGTSRAVGTPDLFCLSLQTYAFQCLKSFSFLLLCFSFRQPLESLLLAAG